MDSISAFLDTLLLGDLGIYEKSPFDWTYPVTRRSFMVLATSLGS